MTYAIPCLAALLCGCSVATEVFAYMARLDPALGTPWYRQSFLVLYPPYGIVVWAWQGAWVVPAAFKWPTVAGVIMAGVTLYNTWPRRAVHTQPQAHWATWAELKAAELLSDVGVVLGKLGRTILRYGGQWHVLIVAGTQTGKTASVVMPTLLEYPGSLIIHDPKQTLYWNAAKQVGTAGYRATLGKVILLAPLSAATDCYNLWDAVRVGTDDEVRDVDVITHYLTNPDGHPIYDDTSAHFRDLVKQFFRGVSLYGLHTGLATTGARFDAIVNRTPWKDLLALMKAHRHPVVQRAASVAERPGDKELGSLQTTMARALDMFVDPRVAHMTSKSSFSLHDLREAEKPCTVYLSIPFSDQERLQALTGVLLQLLFDHSMSRLDGWKHPLLGMIEEYPSLGKFAPITRYLTYAAEYGVQLCLVTPSMKRLEQIYGRDHNFLEGCRVQAAFGLSDAQVAKDFSARGGTRERTVKRVTTLKGGRQSQSISEDVKEEPLLNPTGFLDLAEREVAIFAGRYKRIAQQSRYYEHEPWKRRAAIPPPTREQETAPCLSV